ncbi:MarR family winged helix-turn-helix transcriptional regulator [Deinococcus sp. YIM 77859]|uniref:MarR family winged helix-turn-helix transcriptional regulator n=1 Tax=Deinococcus sp. YIM 77859 TaxID=1540221 RepID=UPI00068BF139|nr:MarR family transcriptional regulator [Deinococcus sp. YIM 77859]
MSELEPRANAPNASAEATQLGEEMKRLHRWISGRVLIHMQDELQDHDLTFPQMTALHQLRAHAPLTVTALAKTLSLSVPATSHLVERLVRRGLAQRRENPENRREKLVLPSAQGLQLVARMDEQFIGAYVAVFGRLRPATVRAATAAMQALLAELALLEENHESSCSARAHQLRADPEPGDQA